MLIEGPGGFFDGLTGWLRRRSRDVGARPPAAPPKFHPPSRARADFDLSDLGLKVWDQIKTWPLVLLLRDMVWSWLAQATEWSGLTDIEVGPKGIRRPGQIAGLLPWSSIKAIDLGFARDNGGVALLLTRTADVSDLLSMEARAERRLVLTREWGAASLGDFAERVARHSPETVIRSPEVGPLFAPLTITNRPDQSPPYPPND